LETEVFGATHHEAFLERVMDWGFPTQLIEAVGNHHESVETLNGLSKIARWADLSAEPHSAVSASTARDRVIRVLMVEEGWDKAGVEGFLNSLSSKIGAAASMLGVDIGEPVDLARRVRRETGINSPDTLSQEDLLAHLQETMEERDELQKKVSQLQGELEALMNFDPLTGLANRRNYIQTLRHEVERANRYKLELSVVVIDLDNFTLLNARYGHSAGDEVLKRVAGLLGRMSRDIDVLARIGGDEFAVILTETNHPGGRIFAERVRAGLEAMRVDVGQTRILLSGSVVGVTLASLHQGTGHEGMHAVVMKACTDLRARGGNRASWAA
jgi:diguanylate cyclase (GGDEF)-like protein